ncbi:MAG: PP0621 family protein [Chromatiales bacterium]|nr:PP0621 family protein [Chromatiales bacterium]
MGIVRLLIIGVVVWLAFKLLKRLTKSPSISKNSMQNSPPKKMVQCQQCGLHVPIDEALSKESDYFCCSEHRDEAS